MEGIGMMGKMGLKDALMLMMGFPMGMMGHAMNLP